MGNCLSMSVIEYTGYLYMGDLINSNHEWRIHISPKKTFVVDVWNEDGYIPIIELRDYDTISGIEMFKISEFNIGISNCNKLIVKSNNNRIPITIDLFH